jgi:RNA polymerase sigma-70 factor, ECF subfamily
MSKDDTYYIKKVLNGDKNAFAFLVDKYKSQAFTLAFRVVKTEGEAEDIAQQAFIKAYTKLKDFRMKSKFSSWLYRIVYNTAISHIRNNKKLELQYEEDFATANILDMDNNDSRNSKNRIQIVHHAIDALPKEEATLITLYYFDDMPVKDISTIIDLSESNVKTKLFRARKKIEKIVQTKLEETYI